MDTTACNPSGTLCTILCFCSCVPQVGFLPYFLDVLRTAASNPTNPLHGKLDFNNMGAAGHSRGAKIAAMHFAGMAPLAPSTHSNCQYVALRIEGFIYCAGQGAFCCVVRAVEYCSHALCRYNESMPPILAEIHFRTAVKM